MRALLGLALVAGPAAAEGFCDELWFARNQLFDRAGYCFGSPLGQAIFDNGNCTTTSPVLSAQDQRSVANLKALAAHIGCDVSTAIRTLDVENLGLRLSLLTVPIPDEFESACFGWRLGPMVLRSGASAEAPVLGQIETGDAIGFAYVPVGPWNYVKVDGPAGRREGWTTFPSLAEETCDQWAG